MKKLKNRKSGIIGKLHYSPDKEYCFTVVTEDPADIEIYKTLEELYNVWTDYEEPKEYWCIDWTGGVNHITVLDDVDKYEENKKEIGNYFETKEEAEKAVEKLKAYKRLKDKGFRFNGGDDACISYILDPVKWDDELEKDFDLLFSGGEE